MFISQMVVRPSVQVLSTIFIVVKNFLGSNWHGIPLH